MQNNKNADRRTTMVVPVGPISCAMRAEFLIERGGHDDEGIYAHPARHRRASLGIELFHRAEEYERARQRVDDGKERREA